MLAVISAGSAQACTRVLYVGEDGLVQACVSENKSAQLNAMDTPELNRRINTLRSLGNGEGNRAAKAQRAIDLIRTLGPYRWAGLYDVLPREIAVIAWSGPQAPTQRDEELLAACARKLFWLWR